MKTIILVGNADTKQVWMDGTELLPYESQSLFNLSQGFGWGSDTSGGKQLALAIMLESTDRGRALALYNQFRLKILANISENKGFTCQINIEKFIHQHDKADLSPRDFFIYLKTLEVVQAI